MLFRAQPVAMDSNQGFNGNFLMLAFQGRINEPSLCENIIICCFYWEDLLQRKRDKGLLTSFA